jgi:hypothetical protein
MEILENRDNPLSISDRRRLRMIACPNCNYRLHKVGRCNYRLLKTCPDGYWCRRCGQGWRLVNLLDKVLDPYPNIEAVCGPQYRAWLEDHGSVVKHGERRWLYHDSESYVAEVCARTYTAYVVGKKDGTYPSLVAAQRHVETEVFRQQREK